MKQIRITILLIAITMVLCACPERDRYDYITVVNKSQKRVGFQLHFLTDDFTNKDMLFQCGQLAFGVQADTMRRLSAGTHSDWMEEMRGVAYLQILFIDGESYEKYMTAPCDTICKYVPVLHCYQLTLSDLQRMNWTVVYPPDEK